MTTHRLLAGLTGVNLLMLLGLLTEAIPATAQAPTGVLRGSALEIVDSEGRVRASIGIMPASADTVLFRLINADGQPSVKISATETAAGLSFVGGDDLSYIILQADGEEAKLQLVRQGGGETVIRP